MKKRIRIKLIYLILIVLLSILIIFNSCNRPTADGSSLVYDKNIIRDTTVEKIKTIYSKFSYEIIEIEGHRYLSRYHGGTIHLESCPCKIKK